MRHPATHTPLADQIREMLATQNPHMGGFTHERIAVGMQDLGHAEWNASTVYRVASGGRFITLDEGASLLGFLKGSAMALVSEIDHVAEQVSNISRKGKS